MGLDMSNVEEDEDEKDESVSWDDLKQMRHENTGV